MLSLNCWEDEMADKKKGFIPLYRCIKDHWIYDNGKPFDDFKAWCDLMMSVNHEEKKININGRVQIIKPGQMWTSYKKLGETWHWSRPKVLRYIKRLKSDGMVFVDATPNGTLLTLINWGNFNSVRNTNVTSNVTTDVTTPITTDVTQTIMNNNVNNEKELKEKGIEYLPIEPPTGGGEWQ